MQEIRSLRVQLSHIIKSIDPTIHLDINSQMSPPTQEQQFIIRQVLKY